jgi:hypothetical protein
MVRVEGITFQVDRSLTITALTARPEQYAALRRFLQEVRRADDIPLTFQRTGGRT